MKIKADWITYLHDLRKRETDEIFQNCGSKIFDNALELGAGDGFTSTILAGYAKNLLCTEINEERLKKIDCRNVRYMILDAEEVADALAGQTFDFIFSSNLLEHLPNVDKALEGTHRILADDGTVVHVLPNRTWKITTILCYLPNKIITVIDKFLSGNLFKRRPGHKFGKPYKEKYGGNNQKIGRKRQSRLTKLFLPPVHGVSSNTLEEFHVFGKKQWIRRFTDAGFDIITIRKITFNSGYGFGFKRMRRLAELLGLKSSFAFVLCKKGCESKNKKLWANQTGDSITMHI